MRTPMPIIPRPRYSLVFFFRLEGKVFAFSVNTPSESANLNYSTYSYESTAIIDPSRKNDFPPTANEEGSLVVETEGQVTPASLSIVPHNRCTDSLGAAEKKDILPITKLSP